MATFVLVHGGWAGGWQWREIASLLRAAGHDVFTPTLTGLGERVHLASPDVGLDTHIQDILMVLEYEDLHDVILVGYSYSGMVITGVAERAPERLAHLVYLDAYVPRDGQSLLDMLGPERQHLSSKRRRPTAMAGASRTIRRTLPGARRTRSRPGSSRSHVTNPAAAACPERSSTARKTRRPWDQWAPHHTSRRARAIRWPVALSRAEDGARPVGDRAAGVGEPFARGGMRGSFSERGLGWWSHPTPLTE